MALTISSTGSEISTEKFIFTAVTDDVLVTSVIMHVLINNTATAHKLEHLPILGTTDEFEFEINSIIKDYFASEFIALTGANQTVIQNAIVGVNFFEVINNVPSVVQHKSFVIIKNMTQDTFEIEDFDLNDYDCGDTGSDSRKFLTSSPNPLPIGDKTSVHVSCLTTSYTLGLGFTPNQEWLIQTLLDGVLVSTTTEDVNVATRSITSFVNSGKYDISNYRFDFNINDGIDEVRILIRDIASPFTTRSETKVFKINDACERSITLSWLNEFGTQDTFTFLGNITRVGKYSDKTFKRVRPVNPLSTNVGDLVYKSDYNHQYDIFSDRMPEASVQWLSKMLINKRAAIQEGTFTQQSSSLNGRLYNWYTIDQGNGGDGTASGGIVNPTQTGWRVPSGSLGTDDVIVLDTFLGSLIGNSGGEIKSTDVAYWDAPNTGANNATGFTAVGSGYRVGTTGAFAGLKISFEFMTHENNGGFFNRYILSSTNQGIGTGLQNLTQGEGIRLIRAAVGGENDGDFISNAYTGNDGKLYDAVVIGTQVWINKNLDETKFNDGSIIPEVQNNATWSGLSSGAFCFYDNIEPPLISVSAGSKYFPIVIETDETTLADKFTPETIFRLKFRLANRRKGLK